ncbi:hypothetical protein LCGC14_1560020 [marine sediment metagenome]|uniref:Uncharacterized protein n=1 Tax=marine sediment metagenome TaxID=412755 RepID=A0A0F9L465_9ZZZZ
MSKPQSASEILKKVTKKIGIQKQRIETYSAGTLRERQASIFTLKVEAPILNSEWDNYAGTEEGLLKLLRLRFRSDLEAIFDNEPG